MDVREKLVELLDEAENQYLEAVSGAQSDSERYAIVKAAYGFYADHLIAHGVTVQETGHWVSLTDCLNAGIYCSICHKKVYKEDYAWCNKRNKLRSDYCPNCGAKMMPQPPKGE